MEMTFNPKCNKLTDSKCNKIWPKSNKSMFGIINMF